MQLALFVSEQGNGGGMLCWGKVVDNLAISCEATGG